MVTGIYKKMLEIEQQAGAKNATAASLKYLNDLLAEKQVSYEEFVLTL